jgi:hypothetical protein
MKGEFALTRRSQTQIPKNHMILKVMASRFHRGRKMNSLASAQFISLKHCKTQHEEIIQDAQFSNMLRKALPVEETSQLLTITHFPYRLENMGKSTHDKTSKWGTSWSGCLW